jgi:hypothetical protein
MKYLIAILCSYILFSCIGGIEDSENKKANLILNSLGQNQAKISLDIDGKAFYGDSSVFTGGGYVDQKGVKISLKDQSMGNVIVSIEGGNWSKSKPYRVEFKEGYPTSSIMGSFLVGKISSVEENKGLGYVLYDGFFELKYVSQEVFLVKVKGKLKKPFGNDPLSNIDGNIVWKKPEYNIEKGLGIEIEFPTIK